MIINPVYYLNDTVYATLKPSPIHGIGVFAIRDIPKGKRYTDISVHNLDETEILELSESDFEKLRPEIQTLILDRTTFVESQNTYFFYSPNHEVCLTSFMNHSETPNVKNDITLRDIKAGEELTEDFRELLRNGAQPHTRTRKHYEAFVSYPDQLSDY